MPPFPLRFPLALLAVLAGSALALTAAAALGVPSPPTTRVFLARHGERMVLPGDADPPLTAAGQRRAAALGRMLRAADVAVVFTTQFGRARTTADSVAAATHAPVEVVHSDSSAALARIVRTRYAGRTVVIVGHSDSLPHVVAELGWEGPEATEGWSYEDLNVLEWRGDEPPRILRLHYGGAADTTGMHGPR